MIKQEVTKEVSMKQLGMACGYLMRSSSIRSEERIQQEMKKFLENCGVILVTEKEAVEFGIGFQIGYETKGKEK